MIPCTRSLPMAAYPCVAVGVAMEVPDGKKATLDAGGGSGASNSRHFRRSTVTVE